VIWKVLVCGWSILCLGFVASAQPNTSNPALPRCGRDQAKVRIRTAVQNVDSKLFVRGLTSDKFRASSGKEIFATQCFTPADQPYAVGIVVDYSGSASSDSIKAFVNGVRNFLRVAHEGNSYFAIGFKSEPFVMLEPTRDAGEIESFLKTAYETKRSGHTAFNDAIEFALSKFPSDDEQRSILLVVSDGDDNNSRSTSTRALARKLRDAGVRAFTFKHNDSGKPNVRTVEPEADSRIAGFALQTGGGGGFFAKSGDLETYLGLVAKLLREEYTLGFTASRAEEKWRPLVVEVKVPKDSPAIRSTVAEWFFY
jgi:hypothetical protein